MMFSRKLKSCELTDVEDPLYTTFMYAVEFTAELGGQSIVTIPPEIAGLLPKSGHARIIILTSDDPADAQWRSDSYEQFLREDSEEDSVYDSDR